MDKQSVLATLEKYRDDNEADLNYFRPLTKPPLPSPGRSALSVVEKHRVSKHEDRVRTENTHLFMKHLGYKKAISLAIKLVKEMD